MRRIYFGFALIANLALSGAVEAADTRTALNIIFPIERETSLALSGAPEHLRGQATVYVFGAKGFTKRRSGKNGFTCLLNRDGYFYGSAAFKPTCWDAEGALSYVPVMLRVGELLAAGKSAEDSKADIAAGFREGRFQRPRRTGVAYMLAGDIELDAVGTITKQAFPGHYMIYAPGVTSGDLGYSQDAAKSNASLPFIFAGGAGGDELAYLITVPHH